MHIRPSGEAFGNSFKQLLQQEKERKKEFVLTPPLVSVVIPCLLYTSDAADERSSVDLGGRRIIKKKKR